MARRLLARQMCRARPRGDSGRGRAVLAGAGKREGDLWNLGKDAYKAWDWVIDVYVLPCGLVHMHVYRYVCVMS